MREITFRAWNPTAKRMDSVITLDWYTNRGCTNLKPSHVFTERKNREVDAGIARDWVLMQYTGLRDKNGKEIFEGDIVRIEAFSDTPHRIVFDRGAFCVVGKTGMDADIKYAEDDRGEIIGNVYENPELLNN